MKRTALILYLMAAALGARADYEILPIETDEAMGEFIRFESRDWTTNIAEVANLEGGRLAANTTWSGEHVILNDLYVPSGVTLTLGPGTQVRFCSGTRIKIEDGGAIVLNGASGEEVVLTGYADETTFAGITLQSSSASYSDNSYVVADGWTFGKFATVSLSDTTAFVAGGQAIIPVSVSGSRESAFSFDWVAETNGVAFASGTMNWSKVGDGTKNITVPFDGAAFAALSNFTVRASLLRCCNASKPKSVVTLSEFITCDIQTDEAMGEFIRFESRDWTTNFTEVANTEGGRLTANTVWSNEHVIVSDVYIPSGVTLTLTADTVVRFCEGTKIKIEDGGALNIVGADGHDVILRGYADDTTYTGIVKMSSGTLTDNSYVRVDGFTLSTLANVALNNSSSFRSSGLALIPVTVSGSRDSAFSIDWVAETNGAPYKSGTMLWSRVSDGTKNISINYGSELDGLTNFTVRVAVHRACYANPVSCVVKISDFIVSDIETDEAMGEFIRFESRDWTTNFTEVANAEGGRLTANTTWTGEHVILSDVYIPSGVTLTLAADALVRFCEGTMIKIEDGGAFNIVGAAGHDVIIRNFDTNTTSRGIVKMSSGTYTDNMYVQYPDFSYGSYPNITLNDAGVGRDAGKVFVPITIGGTSRSQSFNVDWETDKGASGTVTWSQSSDGTKWIEIPVATNAFGGTETYEIRLTAARGANLSVAKATVTIYEFNHPVTETVSVTEGTEPSNEFAVHGDIKTQPIFLNETEELHYSGRWQDKYAPEDVISRICVESDNGITRLAEHPGTEEGAITLKLADYNVGCYTLKHEIIERETEKVVDTVTKTFSVADADDVEMHGGTLTQNETWQAGKTHVVYETVTVPSVYTLFIEPGAIVKFMSGTGITLETGAALFANAIIFTHIDDDTIGGDTLSDGYTVAPSMDSYTLSGNFTFGADTELRYITQSSALTGTISTQRILSRGSTYRVSGTVTVASGGSLTIPSGTVLKMESGASIVVNAGGTLTAKGTRAAPITITSINDDSVSGKTTGSNSNPQPGDWKKLSVSGTARLEYVKMRYGAKGTSTDDMILVNGGVVTFNNSEMAHGQMYAIGVESGHFYATNSIVRDFYCAFRHWPNDEFVNCIFYDCTRLANNNGQKLRNCIVQKIPEAWDWSSGNGVSYANCVVWNAPDEGLQTPPGNFVGKNGNIWGDPLFVDPDNGDFRITADSPCVDAADSVAAPTQDFYGQPRVTITETGGNVLQGQLADIGICEVMPRNVTSDIDLMPKSVRCETNAVPGQLLFVKWEVANIGGAEVADPWRDTISLVSEDGTQEVSIGDKMTSSAIAVGGTVFCSAYFTVPAMAEGTWRPKVNVNSYHDVFEGMLTTNNVLVGSGTVTVAVEKLDVDEGDEGVLTGGTPKVLKMSFADEDENRMVRISVPAGVTVRWGFGFMPGTSRYSGTATASGADVLFKVPDGATDVYLSLDSDETVEYEVETESGDIEVVSVTPNTLPSSGSVRVTITGAGFDESAAVALVNGETSVLPAELEYVDENTLVATYNCEDLEGGLAYDLYLETDYASTMVEQAVFVTKVEGKGMLELSYDIPQSVRVGRTFTFTVTCKNIGTADLCCPIITVEDAGNDTTHPMQFSIDGETFNDSSLHFLATDHDGSFNGIAIGESIVYKLYAKVTPGHNDSKGIVIRAYSEDDAMASSSTVLRQYLTPSLLSESAVSTNDMFKARISQLCSIFGSTNGEFVKGLNEVAREYLEENGVALQRIGDLFGYEMSVAENSIAAVSMAAFEVNAVASTATSLASLDSATGAYLYSSKGGVIYLSKTDPRLSNVTFENKKVALIAHGWNNSMNTSWVTQMAKALEERDFDYVVVVNWEKEASDGGINPDYSLWPTHYATSWAVSKVVSYTIPWLSSRHITDVAEKVSNQLTDFKITPSRCTFIGHSFGAHLASRIAMYLPGQLGRHIGLDTATGGAINDTHEVNASCAAQTEYYRSSYWAGFDEPYAKYNFVVADTKKFTAAGTRGIGGTISDHGYSHDWLVDNIKHGKGSGLGFWLDPTKIRLDKIGSDTKSYIGVIYGPENRLECVYPYDDPEKYGQNPVFGYPGHKSTWKGLYDAWTRAVDLDISNRVRIQNKVKTGMEVSYQIDVIDHVARDVKTIPTRLWNKHLTITLTDKKTGEIIPTNWNSIQKVSDDINGSLVFQNSLVGSGNQRDVIIHFSVVPLEFKINSYADISNAWVPVSDLYGNDNGYSQEITLERSNGPIAAINGYSAPGFVIREPIRYSSEEEFQEAVNKQKTCTYRFDAASSDPGEQKSVRTWLWREKSTDANSLGEDKIYKGEYSATSHCQYPITLTIQNSAMESSTVSGYLEIVPIIDGDETPIEEPKSVDPNEMGGIMGRGDAATQRYVKPGEWMTYTVYFENKTNATAAAQEVKVTNPLSKYLDWSTFEMGEVAFNNQIDLGLSGKQNGTSEVKMNGTNYYVRSSVSLDTENGSVSWYQRIVDKTTDTTWPTDAFAGFLPPNDETFCGEGHLTYRIKVREDAPVDAVISNAATIVFDYNEPITTDPAWWNIVGEFHAPTVDCGNGVTNTLDLVANVPFGELPTLTRKGYEFKGWYFGPNGTGGEVTADTIVPSGLETIYPYWQMLGVAFDDEEIVASEGSNIVISVTGGSEDKVSSIMVYLNYLTASVADIDLKTATVDGVTPKGGIKFPLTLNWAAGDVTSRVISIPVKADKVIEADEKLVFQLASAQGQELGETTVCVATIRDSGYDALKAKIGAGTATKAEQAVWKKLQANADAPYVAGLPVPANGGKVIGSAYWTANKKTLMLKATANKGYVFAGWYEGSVSVNDENDVLALSAPVSRLATLSLVQKPDNDVGYTAVFLTSAFDKANIAATVQGFDFDAAHLIYATNVWAGVYLEWPVAASALSATTVKVAGLPSGLKFAARDVTKRIGTGKTAQTVVVVPANTIYGAPSAASKTKTDRKTGAVTVTPSQMKVTVTTAGRSSQTYQINTTVDPLPTWAVGTFTGPSYDAVGTNGLATVTVASSGKISAKQPVNGKTVILSSLYFDSYRTDENAFYATLTGRVGKETVTNEMALFCREECGEGNSTGAIEADLFDAWQYNWKIEPWKSLFKPFAKQSMEYVIKADGTFSSADEDLALPFGEEVVGRVVLKFTANGAVAVTGEFVTGYNAKRAKYTTVKAKTSTILVPDDDEQGLVFIYLAPKGLPAHARCVIVPWAW